jgi:hypothetical protein
MFLIAGFPDHFRGTPCASTTSHLFILHAKMSSSLKVKAVRYAVKVLTRCISLLIGPAREVQVRARLIQLLEPVVKIETRWGVVKFLCVDPLLEYRARTLLEKEPETIAWIDTFADGDVQRDIGANVGVYSLYAALRGHEVLSFEPSSWQQLHP